MASRHVYLVLFIASISLLCIDLTACAAPGCEQRKLVARIDSPDGAWAASVYENVCSDGGFVTAVFDTVEITRPDEKMTSSPSPGAVFGKEYPRDKPPEVVWRGPRSLEISIPNETWAGKQLSSFADVTIEYKYLPDDPVERACLRQWRSLPTGEMVRRSSSPTENIKAFLAKCQASGGPK